MGGKESLFKRKIREKRNKLFRKNSLIPPQKFGIAPFVLSKTGVIFRCAIAVDRVIKPMFLNKCQKLLNLDLKNKDNKMKLCNKFQKKNKFTWIKWQKVSKI